MTDTLQHVKLKPKKAPEDTTIFIDMDETLYGFRDALNKVAKGPPEMLQKDFFKDLKIFPFAKFFVTALYNRGYDIHIATKYLATKPDSAREKLEAIARDLPFLWDKVILIQDKNYLKGDYLVDDNLEYTEGDYTLIAIDPDDPESSWWEFIRCDLDEWQIISEWKELV